MMGKAKIDGVFADIYAVSWVSHLRMSLAAEALLSDSSNEAR
jgi:hypothetical protein